DDRELASVLAVARPFALDEGEILFAQGDEAGAMYLVTGGALRITARLLGEDEVELATMRAGEIAGELGLVDRGERTATARALESVRGLAFDANAFAVLRASASRAARKIVTKLAMIVADRIAEIERALAS